jgi:diguanylate cyclase (GGDEF)-like protein/PAS domain S-box-containing protein
VGDAQRSATSLESVRTQPRASGDPTSVTRRLQAQLGGLLAHVEDAIAPSDLLASGEIDIRIKRKRTFRIVVLISLVSVAVFVPAMHVANVPDHLRLPFLLTTIIAACVISWSLLLVRPGSRLVPLAVMADAVVIAGLGLVLGDYYHQLALLYGLVVAGHTAIHGFRSAILMAALGSVIVPFAITSSLGLNATDVIYAFVYLLGIATIPWLYIRLSRRGLEALGASARKFRGLVEHVPAVVYTTDAGPDGACQYISPRAQEVFGFPPEAWTDDPGFWRGRVHPDDRHRMVAYWTSRRAHPDASSEVIEYRVFDAQGRLRWVRDEACLLDSDDPTSKRWTGFLTDVSERKELEGQLQHQAFHDPLTGLPNRALFTDRLDHALTRPLRRPETLAVLFLDLDDFKTVNDGIGHDAGDELLVAVAGILRASIRPMDTAARLGGDEFAVLLEDLNEPTAAQDVAERILAALQRPTTVAGQDIVISASIGIAHPSSRTDSAAQLMRNADAAMYAAKRRGKGRHEIFAPVMAEAAVKRLELAGAMRQALELGQFTLHYQPLVRLSDESVTGFEALLRWNHPQRGLVAPGEFIPEAEATGQIIAIGRIVLEQACRQAKLLEDAHGLGRAPSMSVNVSARQFRDPELIDTVAEVLARTRLDASRLTLEITESTIMEDSEAALERLRDLKGLGVRIAIDDFGTGYSSLSYLRRLPVDVLKIDKSFVDGVADGGEALTRVIVSIGESLRLHTVAEGVELSSQAAALRRMGCEVAQGFHFARPMASNEILTRLPAQRHLMEVTLPPDKAGAHAPTIA